MSIKYKVVVSIAAIALLAAGCNQAKPAVPAATTTPVQNTETSPQPSTPAAESQPKVTANVVTYSDAGFSPATLTIKKGETVVFKNTASDDVRVASNPHPTHEGYPTTGGCVSSTFDSCSKIAPGQSWSFQFDLTGSWGYHNHLNPSEGGTIIVK